MATEQELNDAWTDGESLGLSGFHRGDNPFDEDDEQDLYHAWAMGQQDGERERLDEQERLEEESE